MMRLSAALLAALAVSASAFSTDVCSNGSKRQNRFPGHIQCYFGEVTTQQVSYTPDVLTGQGYNVLVWSGDFSALSGNDVTLEIQYNDGTTVDIKTQGSPVSVGGTVIGYTYDTTFSQYPTFAAVSTGGTINLGIAVQPQSATGFTPSTISPNKNTVTAYHLYGFSGTYSLTLSGGNQYRVAPAAAFTIALDGFSGTGNGALEDNANPALIDNTNGAAEYTDLVVLSNTQTRNLTFTMPTASSTNAFVSNSLILTTTITLSNTGALPAASSSATQTTIPANSDVWMKVDLTETYAWDAVKVMIQASNNALPEVTFGLTVGGAAGPDSRSYDGNSHVFVFENPAFSFADPTDEDAAMYLAPNTDINYAGYVRLQNAAGASATFSVSVSVDRVPGECQSYADCVYDEDDDLPGRSNLVARSANHDLTRMSTCVAIPRESNIYRAQTRCVECTSDCDCMPGQYCHIDFGMCENGGNPFLCDRESRNSYGVCREKDPAETILGESCRISSGTAASSGAITSTNPGQLRAFSTNPNRFCGGVRYYGVDGNANSGLQYDVVDGVRKILWEGQCVQGECVECVPSDSAATCSGTKTCIDGRLVPALQVEGSARTLSNDITAQLLIVILVFIILLLIIVIANSCRARPTLATVEGEPYGPGKRVKTRVLLTSAAEPIVERETNLAKNRYNAAKSRDYTRVEEDEVTGEV